MNRLLVGILDLLNKLVAILLILGGAAAGFLSDPHELFPAAPAGISGTILAAVVGLIIGLLAAGLLCGSVAALVTLSREATAIREGLERRHSP